MKMKLTPIAFSLLLSVLSSSSNVVYATSYTQGSVLSDKVFYQIGGGSAIMPPPSKKRMHEYSVGLGWKTNLMCGNFDIKTTVKNQLNGITEGFKDLYSNVIESATGAVASLPAMIIQRANPQLYDILSNGLYQAKIDFDSLKTSCEEMSNKLADHVLDNKWLESAKLENFKNIVSSETDAKKAKKKSEQELGKKGQTWIGGEKKGGEGQDRIEVLKDVVESGFNILQGRNVLDKSKVPETQCDGMLCTEWNTPEQAAEWVRDVLGDKSLSTCESCGTPPTSTKAGTGLAPKIEDETVNVMTHFQGVLNSDNITGAQLASISSTTMPITRSLVESLREDPDVVVLATRLSQEVAISRTIEKALVARRMILAGMREPNVSANTTAQEELMANLTALDREIEQVKLEMDIQKSLTNNTAMAILNNRINETQSAVESNSSDDSDSKFRNLTKEQGANNIDNRNGRNFNAKDKEIVLPIPDRTSGGLGNINGRYNGIGSSTNTGNISSGRYNRVPAITGNALEQATGLLKHFEGYRDKAYWDVNAHRVGYGSDTITKADGTVVRVTKDMQIDRADAERDLARRTQEFANTARRNVSPDVWNKLTPNAQAALTSYAYNYGHVTQDVAEAARRSVQSGNMNDLANAVRNRQTNNNSVNARRRNQEADYILGL
ncbi:integrating conjugative element protein [Rodentibacter caecimuris]|uniref:integrating conjugative element protein n=1 Tax=Rodentibacter caecimuris TaxID=1796644 RepID=UPI0022498D36|nr:integrating conjugative element protein [Rodentibacter heylii]MCX2960998.1 integrating conjugative element protein [Rodentibacter heylii]